MKPSTLRPADCQRVPRSVRLEVSKRSPATIITRTFRGPLNGMAASPPERAPPQPVATSTAQAAGLKAGEAPVRHVAAISLRSLAS